MKPPLQVATNECQADGGCLGREFRRGNSENRCLSVVNRFPQAVETLG